MARVVITDKLREQILQTVRSKHIASVEKEMEDFLMNRKEELYACAVSREQQALMRQLPTDLLQMNRNMFFKWKDKMYTTGFTTARALPTSFHYTYNPPELQIPIGELRDAFTALVEKRERQHHEESVLTKQLSGLMNKCVTLKQLMVAWPSVLEFCPSDVVERFNRPETRRTVEPKDLVISEEAKLALVKVRMS